MMQRMLDTIGVNTISFVAGVFGSIVAVCVMSDREPRRAVAALAAGIGSACYLSPIIASFVQKMVPIDEPNLAGASGFICGVIGLLLTDYIWSFAGRRMQKSIDQTEE